MTVQECISYIDAIEPNAYSDTQKAGWLSECEGKVYTQLFLCQPYEFTPITQSDSRTLALPAPYDRIYPRYLQAMIHYANGEYDRYANSMAVFNEVWAELNRWFGGDYDVTDRLRSKRFEIEIPPGVDYYSLMDVLQGCAIVAGRLEIVRLFDHPYFVYTFLEPYTETSYSFKQNDTWYTFTTTGIAELADGFVKGDTLTSRSGYLLNFYRGEQLIQQINATQEHTGDADLIDSCVVQVWMGDKDLTVGSPLPMTERGRQAIPMLIADRGGETLGVTVGPGGGLAFGKNSMMRITGRILIPDEEWAYDDRYARRRDARWHG